MSIEGTPTLKVGDVICIRFDHWPACKPTQKARVSKQVDIHCQLHGDYRYTTWRVRRIKDNGKESYQYDLPENLEGVEVEVVGHGTG